MALRVDPDGDGEEASSMLADAQDLYFEGRCESAVDLCRAILAINNKDGDTYRLLFISLFNLQRYSEALDIAQHWGINCGENLTQLDGLLRSAYSCGNGAVVKDAAEKLSLTNCPAIVMARARAFAADVGVELNIAAVDRECDGEDDDYISSYVAWADHALHGGCDELHALVNEITERAPEQRPHHGLPLALFVLAAIECGQADDACAAIERWVASGASVDRNVDIVRRLSQIAKGVPGDFVTGASLMGVDALVCSRFERWSRGGGQGSRAPRTAGDDTPPR
eukprot:Opistho-2@52174